MKFESDTQCIIIQIIAAFTGIYKLIRKNSDAERSKYLQFVSLIILVCSAHMSFINDFKKKHKTFLSLPIFFNSQMQPCTLFDL